MDINITKVITNEQVEETAKLASEIWREHYIQIITSEQIDYMLDKFQSVPAIQDQIEQGNLEYFLISSKKSNSALDSIGYLAIKQEGDRIFLSKWYIQKENRGKGYASQAFKWLTERCLERGVRVIWLTVNRFNHSSIAVYERLGFRTVKLQAADIGNGFIMDDYVMEFECM